LSKTEIANRLSGAFSVRLVIRDDQPSSKPFKNIVLPAVSQLREFTGNPQFLAADAASILGVLWRHD
jgi:hypothetical protein